MNETRPYASWDRWLIAATVAVVAWRALALRFPHPAGTDPELVRWLAALMGLWFMVWGLWAFREARDTASLLFACYGVTAGLHWGGPAGVGPEPTDNVLLAFYVVVSSALNQSLFLHLAVAFPPAYRAAGRRTVLAAVYLPAVLGALLLAVLAVRPSDVELLRLSFVFFPVGVLYSLIGGGLFIHRLMTADRTTRRSRRLALVVAAMVAGWLPHAAVSAGAGPGPELEGLFNLPFALLPPALAWALARPRCHPSHKPPSA